MHGHACPHCLGYLLCAIPALPLVWCWLKGKFTK
jgi:hypothetical protein